MNDAALKSVATKFRAGILDGRKSDLMCFAVCAPLQGYLRAAYNFETELVEAEIDIDDGPCNHVWLRLADGRVLDPTIDQFKMFMGKRLPKVYIGPALPILHRTPTPDDCKRLLGVAALA